ncbi:hypothetical protein DRQ33_05190 [bacterium]|nr:MAG: hypothetical protein DRQ33_05190 [bacterium]
MVRGNGAGRSGQGSGSGRRGRGRGKGPYSAGPGGYCVCPNCGNRIAHTAGTPCYQTKCPQCGQQMIREVKK